MKVGYTPHNNMTPAPTLWQLCTDYFFPRRLELRSDKTRKLYRLALAHYGRHLGHDPTLDDLDDDLVAVWVGAQLDVAGSVYSVRERLGRVLALWRFLAARGKVQRWPTIKRPAAPDPLPVALTQEELRALFDSAMYEPGKIDGIRAGWWWQAYLAFVWSTAERRTAALSLRWEYCDIKSAVAVIPPQFRKGGKKAGVYRLWPEVVLLIERIAMPPREKVFPWSYSEGAYYYRYGRILERAGLPNDRKHKTHCLRCSHATWTAAFGGNATAALGHNSPETTQRHYIDVRLLPSEQRKLFVPW
jgi:integrase